MKKTNYFLLFILIMMSCTVHKKPVFVNVTGIEVVSADFSKIILKADAVFQNPNSIGGELSTDSIQVYINGIQTANVFSKPYKVPPKQEFSIPLKVEIPTKNIFGKSNKGFLGGLLNAVLNQTVLVRFKGELHYKVLGFSSSYMIDVSQKVTL